MANNFYLLLPSLFSLVDFWAGALLTVSCLFAPWLCIVFVPEELLFCPLPTEDRGAPGTDVGRSPLLSIGLLYELLFPGRDVCWALLLLFEGIVPVCPGAF